MLLYHFAIHLKLTEHCESATYTPYKIFFNYHKWNSLFEKKKKSLPKREGLQEYSIEFIKLKS